MHSCNLVNSLYLFLNNKKELNGPLPLSLLAAFALANISVQIFINPYILYGFNTIRYYSDDSLLAKRYKKDVNSNDLFTEDWKYEIAAKVKSIELTKKFANQGYQLANMAVDLDIPKYQLNHYFKEFSQESFSEWKNRNRVLYAIELIKTGYLNTYTVETLSQECGYKSRGNFNSAFLEVTGKRLSEYVKTC
jgi:AraC-like DNA-binding protein